MEWKSFYMDVLPFLAMVTVECTNVGLNTLYKAASLKGMNYYVFILYSYSTAAIFLLPVYFLYRSKPGLPSFKFNVLSRICLLAVIGLLAQISGNKGIAYSSPTLASAMSNLTPAFTFIFAVLFRMEKLALRRAGTLAKIVGTITSISGALVVLLYKGPTIWSGQATAPDTRVHLPLGSLDPSEWIIGGILLATQYMLYALFFIVQAQVMRMYPVELLVTFYYTLCFIVIAAPMSFFQVRDLDAWRLKPGIGLVAIVYAGFFGHCFGTGTHTWGVHLKGPLYVAMFKPLSIAIAAIMGIIFLGDALHLGCVIGAVVISVGFYAVTWGKAHEKKLSQDIESAPLLQTTSTDK